MKKTTPKDVQLTLTRATRSLYFFITLYAVSIIVFDSGNLITREAVIQRWSIATAAFVVNTIIWYLSADGIKNRSTRFSLTVVLALVFIAFAGFSTYWERGMASTSTIFYVIPLLIAATLKHRHTLLAVTALSAGTYAFAAVKYFNDFFNEGYRIQLWGNLLLYMGTLFAIAWLIMVIAGLRHDSK